MTNVDKGRIKNSETTKALALGNPCANQRNQNAETTPNKGRTRTWSVVSTTVPIILQRYCA
jgi:hypothetical protein